MFETKHRGGFKNVRTLCWLCDLKERIMSPGITNDRSGIIVGKWEQLYLSSFNLHLGTFRVTKDYNGTLKSTIAAIDFDTGWS